eukprot:CAMPEP_0117684082 /NCGR_PEP_ID=MMETSP0804-20121206/20857_1 /TAXON_ID=1074897 /ORGANISM="Tetraselmis astigmatica, Strain CCMP880" /LENGTH=293 /DNA_ID=CAMNT_0005494945 /DNA_START=650 /DNA_END=1529 /DNA_ORIENTATION=+
MRTSFVGRKDAQDAIANGEMDLSQPMAPELTSLRLTSMMDDLPEEGNGPCCNCTMSSAKWVMHHVVEHIKAKCEETECPKLKAMCEKAKEHPKVTFGFLLAAVRPLSLGYAWCNGKGECGKNSSLESLPTTDDEMSAIDAVSSLYTSVEYDMEPEDDESVAFDLADQAEEVFDNEMRPPCKMCVKSVTKGVMFHVIGKITKYCFKTEDPKIKKMCKFAAMHKQLTFGYLFYKVRPIEFAAGFCMGKGKCYHPSCHSEEMLFEAVDDSRLSVSEEAAVIELLRLQRRVPKPMAG